MYICKNCNREFETPEEKTTNFCTKKCRYQYIGKKGYNTQKQKGSYVSPFKTWKGQKRSPFGTWKCPHCGYIGSTRRILEDHKHKEHPEFSKIGWNKGLTKETCLSVARNSEAAKKAMNTPESKKKRSEVQKKIWTEERRKKRSEEKKSLYRKHPELHPNRKLANNRSKMSYPEQIAYDWLTKHNIEFEHQKRIGRFYADFFVPSINSLIEIDGTYWHNEESDSKRDAEIMTNFGYTTLRIKATSHIETELSKIFNVSN